MAVCFRAEQVGSLLRPPELLEARASFAEGRLPLEELRLKEDDAISAALERQRQTGIDVFSDGEMRRGSWLSEMAEAVEGFVQQRVEVEWKGPGGGREGSTALAVGAKLKKLRNLTAFEVPFLKKKAGGAFKVTIPAPSNFLIASYREGVTDAFYPTRKELLADLTEIIRSEIQWLVSQGVPYIQLDAPYYSLYLDDGLREQLLAAGRNPDAEFAEVIQGDNFCLSGIARENLTVSVHICRGNSRSRWLSQGAYDAIAEKLFGLLNVDTFLLEYDTQRSGGFEPLRVMPKGKNVVLGLVTTKVPELESQDDLQRRVEEASRYVPIDHLAISPQCGFASVASGNLISIDDQWRKLELVVDTARKIWN
jgi:methionine synthase II (cobalamin-independent)